MTDPSSPCRKSMPCRKTTHHKNSHRKRAQFSLKSRSTVAAVGLIFAITACTTVQATLPGVPPTAPAPSASVPPSPPTLPATSPAEAPAGQVPSATAGPSEPASPTETVPTSPASSNPETATPGTAAVEPPPPAATVGVILREQINGVINAYGDHQVGVALIDMADGQTYEYGARTKFVAASTAKILVAAAYYHLVESGSASLTAPLGGYAASFQIRQMVQYSNNESWALLRDAIGYRSASIMILR
jgi:CubicO group peptidase (beta-lactamase class C family)